MRAISLVILAILPLACAKNADEFVGKWGHGTASLEVFSDESWMHESTGGQLAGTWSVLEDGRLKLAYSMLGPTNFLFAERSEGALFLTPPKGDREKYVKTRAWQASEKLDPGCAETLRASCADLKICAFLRTANLATCQGECLKAVLAALDGAGVKADWSPRGLDVDEAAPCVGYREDIQGTENGARCLARFLGNDFKVVEPGRSSGYCTHDWFAYNVILN